MDIADLAAAPRTVVLAGLAYRVGPLTMSDWGALQQFVKAHTLDPETRVLARLARARAMGIDADPADRQFLLREARKDGTKWPPRVGSPEWWDALADAEGGGGDVEFLWVLLRKHQPSISREQAATLAEGLSSEDSIRLMYLALGVEPPDPKGRPAAAGDGPADPDPAPNPNPATGPTTGGSSSTTSTASATSPIPTSSP